MIFTSFSCRVDHLYTFFVQWSPEIYNQGKKKRCKSCNNVRKKRHSAYRVVDKDISGMGKAFRKTVSKPKAAKKWEVSLAQAQQTKKKQVTVCWAMLSSAKTFFGRIIITSPFYSQATWEHDREKKITLKWWENPPPDGKTHLPYMDILSPPLYLREGFPFPCMKENKTVAVTVNQ